MSKTTIAATVTRSTVIVTRPAQDAAPLIELLRERGHEVIAFPVLGIEPVEDAGALAVALARIADYRLVVFVSPNAIRQALAHRSGAWPRDVTIAVMGPGSVSVLHGLGITASDVRIVSPSDARSEHAVAADATSSALPHASASLRRYDSEALLAALDAAIGLRAGFTGRVLIVRGNGGRAWFADRLRERGIRVDEIESYRRVMPEPDEAASSAMRRLFRDDAHAAFIVTSSEGLSNLVALIEAVVVPDAAELAGARERLRAWLFRQCIVAPHARIAEKARRMGFSTISLAAPGVSGIVAAIE